MIFSICILVIKSVQCIRFINNPGVHEIFVLDKGLFENVVDEFAALCAWNGVDLFNNGFEGRTGVKFILNKGLGAFSVIICCLLEVFVRQVVGSFIDSI